MYNIYTSSTIIAIGGRQLVRLSEAVRYRRFDCIDRKTSMSRKGSDLSSSTSCVNRITPCF